MKRKRRYEIALLVIALLVACVAVPKMSESLPEPTYPTQTQPTTEPPQTTPPTEPAPTETTVPSEPTQPTETTAPPVPTGWVEKDGVKYYYSADGTPATGWQEIEGSRYYFRKDGAMFVGWLQTAEGLYFLGLDGIQRTGWIESDGKRYYLNPNAAGAACIGWLDFEGKRYYFNGDGVMQTGWLTLNGNRYYLKNDGAMARGRMEIEGKVWWFTKSGTSIILVNPWNFVPDDYSATIVTIDVGTESDPRVSTECADALAQMLSDCRKAGLNPQIASSYRTHGDQIWLYNRKVNYYLGLGYSEADAKAAAATIIAVPGTSEHELGLALDLVDASNRKLDESQEKTPVQQWLMKNSWRYGFILRYPNEKSGITGIVYEPWHYRYVGVETAKEVYESGLCLEEYLNSLS